jgi:formylglycine-generating enzyme required for sulfatase activity
MFMLASALVAVSPVHAAGKRVALVIGNGAYIHTDRWVALINPVRDAEAMADMLKNTLGFDEVEVVRNATRENMLRALQRFHRSAKGADVALLFYAGHATHPEGEGGNYLLPIDARAEDDDALRIQALAFDAEVVKLEESKAKMRIVLLDACRTNLSGAKRGSGSARGLRVPPETSERTLIGYATKAGRAAADGAGRNSPYTSALVKHLPRAAGVSLLELLDDVGEDVGKATRQEQIPTRYGDVPVAVDLFGNRVARLSADGLRASAPPKEDLFPVGKPFRDCPECPEMVVIPEGEFMMGSPSKEPGRERTEGPQRRVRVDRVAIGKYEVSYAQWKACVNEGVCQTAKGMRHSLGGDDHPVVNVDWDDAQIYVTWLSRKTRNTYALLTEAQWEYAARAGKPDTRWWGASETDACRYANVSTARTRQKHSIRWNVFECEDEWLETAPIGRFQPNPWGLHDMLGNVAEWVEDCYDENAYSTASSDARAQTVAGCGTRVVRGGSWKNNPNLVRSASRNAAQPDTREEQIGFRVARVLLQ